MQPLQCLRDPRLRCSRAEVHPASQRRRWRTVPAVSVLSNSKPRATSALAPPQTCSPLFLSQRTCYCSVLQATVCARQGIVMPLLPPLPLQSTTLVVPWTSNLSDSFPSNKFNSLGPGQRPSAKSFGLSFTSSGDLASGETRS